MPTFRLRTHTLGAALTTVIALLAFTPSASAGKLSRASSAARSGGGGGGGGGSYSHSSSGWHGGGHHGGECCGYSSGSDADGAALGLVLYAVFSPWVLPNMAVEEGRPSGAAERVRFADYPYAPGSAGLILDGPLHLAPPPADDLATMDAPDEVAPEPVPAGVASRKVVAAELGLEGGIGTNDAVVRSGFHAEVQFPFRLGLDTSWSLYREAGGGGVDQLGMGREHLNIRFAESSHVYFQSGVGPQHFLDAQGWVNGIDVTWGFVAFPAKPVVLAVEGSLGSLGHVFAPGARAELGFMLNRFEIGAGFEERWIGPVALGGPFVAVTAWL